MKNTRTISGTLHVVERMKSSTNGNPRYLCMITGEHGYSETFCTAPDSSHGYSIRNHDGKQVEARIGMHYNRLTLDSIEAVNDGR